jgi:hypothetical protein
LLLATQQPSPGALFPSYLPVKQLRRLILGFLASLHLRVLMWPTSGQGEVGETHWVTSKEHFPLFVSPKCSRILKSIERASETTF